MKKRVKKIRFGSYSPKYPLRAFMSYFYLSDEDNHTKILYPNTQIFTDISEISFAALKLEENININNNLKVSDRTIILPLTLIKLYPLEKRFWKKPSLHYDYSERISLFLKILDNFPLYKLIITPLKIRNKTVFVAAIPFFVSASDNYIEQFMLFSDFPVEEEAKYAAIYELQKPFILNWQNGEIEKINSLNKSLKN